MKKILTFLLAVITVFCLAACTIEEGATSGKMTIIVDGKTEYVVEIDKVEDLDEGVLSVLEYCAEQNNFSIKCENGMLKEFDTLKEGNGSYLWLETTCEKDFDLTTYATKRDYKDKHFVSSGVGVKEMHVEDGVYIYISLIKFG